MNLVNKIIKKIKAFENIAIFTHKNIDGDSYSCSYGLALTIKQKYPGKQVKVFTDYDYLRNNFPFLEAKQSFFSTSVQGKTLGIIGDTAIKERIQFFEELDKCQEIICFDHHQNTKNFTTSIYWHEPSYHASSLQAAQIAFAMLDNNLEENTAMALLFGILTDTGFFKYSTNNAHVPLVYSQLLSFTTHEKMNELFIKMNTKTKEDLAIQQHVYSSIIYKDNVCYVVLDHKVIEKYGYAKLKLKVSSIANIEGLDYWAFFMETNENGFKYKASLRTSRGDVNVIAQAHHGGGHIKAAGCFAKDEVELNVIVDKLNLAK